MGEKCHPKLAILGLYTAAKVGSLEQSLGMPKSFVIDEYLKINIEAASFPMPAAGNT